jgi:hypothetical protein
MSQTALITSPPASETKSALVSGASVQALVPRSMEEAFRVATAIARSNMAPKDFKTPEAILVAIMHGMEIGLPPMQALQSIAIVNGRPSLWGDGLVGLVRGSGVCDWIKNSYTGAGDTLTAVCETQRKGEPPASYSFSVSDAKKAGLWGKTGPWSQYPSRMLLNRARAFLLRDVYADVLRGVQAREEVEDMPPVNTTASAAEADAHSQAIAALSAPIDETIEEGEVTDAIEPETETFAPPAPKMVSAAETWANSMLAELHAMLAAPVAEEYDAWMERNGAALGKLTKNYPDMAAILNETIAQIREKI